MMYHDLPTHQLADVLMHPVRGLLERILPCGGITESYLQSTRSEEYGTFIPIITAPVSCIRQRWVAMPVDNYAPASSHKYVD